MNNRKRIDSYIPDAIKALEISGIAKNGKIDSSYRGQISSFGAAVTVGSFKQAVAFFAQDAKSSSSGIKRSYLILAIDYILNSEDYAAEFENEDKKAEKISSIKEGILKLTDDKLLKGLENQYLDAAVALKVAMGLFDMSPEKNKKEE